MTVKVRKGAMEGKARSVRRSAHGRNLLTGRRAVKICTERYRRKVGCGPRPSRQQRDLTIAGLDFVNTHHAREIDRAVDHFGGSRPVSQSGSDCYGEELLRALAEEVPASAGQTRGRRREQP